MSIDSYFKKKQPMLQSRW